MHVKYQEFFKDMLNVTPRQGATRKRGAAAEVLPSTIGDVDLENSKTSRHNCSKVEPVSNVTECLMFAIERERVIQDIKKEREATKK